MDWTLSRGSPRPPEDGASSSRAINPRTYARPATLGDGVSVRPSQLEGAGNGLYADEAYAKGEVVTEYVGRGAPGELLSAKDVAKLTVQTHVLTMENQHSYIDGLRTPVEGAGAGSFANDCFSCGKLPVRGGAPTFTYNVKIVKSRLDFMNRAFLVATRPIARGEELYLNYEDREFAMGEKRRSQFGQTMKTEDWFALSVDEENAMLRVAAAMANLKLATEVEKRAAVNEKFDERVYAAAKSTAADLREGASRHAEDIKTRLKRAREQHSESKRAHEVVKKELDKAAKEFAKAKAADDGLRSEGWNELHSRGFVKVSQAEHGIGVDGKDAVNETAFMPIFNDTFNRSPEVASHRLQGRLAKDGRRVSPQVQSFENEATAFLQRKRWLRTASGTGKKAFKRGIDAYVLRSVAACKDALKNSSAIRKPQYGCTDKACPGGCAKQKSHGDAAYPRTYYDEEAWKHWFYEELKHPKSTPLPPLPPNGDVPLVALYATQEAKLHVVPFDTGVEEVVELEEGDLIVFRGDLAHAGAAYSEDNLRLHIYFDSRLHPRVPDATYLAKAQATSG